jgi:hypothetical protein
MPKTKIDYSKTIFYRIVCNDINITDCYVGHTTNFIKRKQQHKIRYKIEKYNNMKIYQFIRDNGGWVNWSMIMIKEQECNDLNDALRQERKYIEEYKASLNCQIPSRTKKEYNTQYRENNKDYMKQYYNNNTNKLKEYANEYSKLTIFCNCCNKDINLMSKARHYRSKLHIKKSEIII